MYHEPILYFFLVNLNKAKTARTAASTEHSFTAAILAGLRSQRYEPTRFTQSEIRLHGDV
jgi:hypothetical protein